MKIYVCEQYHDNDCDIFPTLEAALAHHDGCGCCEAVQEYELLAGSSVFTRTELSIAKWACQTCGAESRTDLKQPLHDGPYNFCSEACIQAWRIKCEEHERELKEKYGSSGGWASTASFERGPQLLSDEEQA